MRDLTFFVALWRPWSNATLPTQDRRMDAPAEPSRVSTHENYKSRPGALIWFFRKSRDRWKTKYHDVKTTVKALKNQIAAVTRSREQWRLKAQRACEHLSALEAEVAGLRARVAAEQEKKRTRQITC